MTQLKQISIYGVVFSTILLIASPGLASIRYISKEGNLTVEYGKQCSTTKPTARYRVRNGASGELIALTCERLGGDFAEFRFRDTSGKERCYGRMTQVWSRKSFTIWKIDGAVSGYVCSQAGKTFQVEMGDAQQF